MHAPSLAVEGKWEKHTMRRPTSWQAFYMIVRKDARDARAYVLARWYQVMSEHGEAGYVMAKRRPFQMAELRKA